MEADWSVALGADDPVLTVPWAASGGDAHKCEFINLRLDSERIDEIEEARSRPALRSALMLLNGAASPLWTAKCDAWASSADQGDAPFDRFEMNAEPGETVCGSGSYVDLLSRDAGFMSCFERQERWLRMVTETLRVVPAGAARVELVVRRAEIEGAPGFGVTWFVEGCGATTHQASQAWEKAFNLALAVIMDLCHIDGAAPVDDTMTETGE